LLAANQLPRTIAFSVVGSVLSFATIAGGPMQAAKAIPELPMMAASRMPVVPGFRAKLNLASLQAESLHQRIRASLYKF
jgi:hypothetical protein